MSNSDGQVVRSAAEIYETFFVPALFGEWGPRVADALSPPPGKRVLDAASGTGVLARELARRLGSAFVSALDCNPDMLDVARSVAPDVDYHLGRVEELPFESDSFAAVGCQFGLMFFRDRTRALRELLRVLQPGGRLAVAVWASLEQTPGYSAMAGLLARLFGDSIANELRAPFCLGEPDALRAVFEEAGIHDLSIETIVGSARFLSIEDWVHTEIRGWTLANKLDDAEFATLARAASEHLQRFVVDGCVQFESPAHLVVVEKLP